MFQTTGDPSTNCEHFRTREMPESHEQRESDKHLREIAEKVRQLARQTQLPKAREELFDLADRVDRMTERARTSRG
jgi:hypothetical protein